MNETISTTRKYYLQALHNGQWLRVHPYNSVTLDEARKIKDSQLSPPCRIVEVETIKRVVPVE